MNDDVLKRVRESTDSKEVKNQVILPVYFIHKTRKSYG